MKYELFKTSTGNTLGKVKDFDEAPPILAAEKDMEWREYIAPAPIPETQQQAIDRLTWAVQAHLDSKAREKNYDGIVSACSYAAVANQFQAESQSYLVWRANVWATCYELLALMTEAPTNEELISMLPTLVLPT